jgi:hypothetical protein
MMRFEECHPPEIVKAVYARLEREEQAKIRKAHADSIDTGRIVFLDEYRKARVNTREEVL